MFLSLFRQSKSQSRPSGKETASTSEGMADSRGNMLFEQPATSDAF
jgi:hypothetical protein